MDLLIIGLLAFLAVFLGLISYLFLRGVAATIIAVIKKDKYATKLSPWQMFYHIFIGFGTTVWTLFFLFGIVISICGQFDHP